MSNGDDVPILRKSHIKRIYKDNDPDANPDLWIDVERIDEIILSLGKQYDWQTSIWRFDWDRFDPDGANVTKKKIKQNPGDSDDDAIEVPSRDVVFVTTGRKQHFQGYRHYFINNSSNSTRETRSRRVYHYDIPTDKLDDNQNPPLNPDDYIKALGRKDKDQYVEVEILRKYWTNERQIRDQHGNLLMRAVPWQEKRWLLDIDGVDPLLKDRDGDTSKDGTTINPDPDAGPTVDPPWRLDPLQNIVNVSWLGGLAVEFGDEDQDA